MNNKTNELIIPILECFGGTDGGIHFIKFRTLIDDMANCADNNDIKAQQIIDVVTKFNKLLDIAKEL